jgi:hypothetical protein
MQMKFICLWEYPIKHLMTCAIVARAADTCAWYRAQPVPGDWWLVHGKCEIRIVGDKFTALLYDSNDPKFLRVKVSGVIQGAKVRASIETEESDAEVDTLSGNLIKGDAYKNVILLGSGYDTVGIKYDPQ